MATKTNKSSDIKKPTEAQLKARAKFAEMAKSRAKTKNKAITSPKIAPTSDLNTKDEYIITAKLNDKEMECKTNNLEEAIESLGLNFLHIKTRMRLNIKQGKKQVEKFLPVPMVKKIFRNALARRIFIRKLIFK